MTTTTISFAQVQGFDASSFDAIFLRTPPGSNRLVFSKHTAQRVVPGAKLPITDHQELLVEVPDSNDRQTFNDVKAALLPTTGLDGWHTI
ncbi:hypothetical protein CS062_17470 [Roseateles chitinivorans]|uniref:Uncharacterized protein n=1 Tax=Roseateles chitinivorans TaxID=2917965 RepID=A0A2G9C6E8_9BURK|nr:hypothetical protein [Roseateles chitinivorans]PIM51915.1 hypothetical protein CS062_17470 [Roseateles chitinivorans]